MEYAQQYTIPKNLDAQPNRRTKKVVVITRPFISPDPAGPKYEQYCQQSLMKHKSFRQVTELLAGHGTYTEAYADFLQAEDIPPSLKEDIFRLSNINNRVLLMLRLVSNRQCYSTDVLDACINCPV